MFSFSGTVVALIMDVMKNEYVYTRIVMWLNVNDAL